MRCDTDGTQVFDMIFRVIGLVGASRNTMTNGFAFGFQHGLRGAAFGRAIGPCDRARHGKPVPVLHGHVAHVAELCLRPAALR